MNGEAMDMGRGWLEWGGVPGPGIGFAVLIAAVGFAGWYWWRSLGALPLSRRVTLTGLRGALVALLVFLLLQPIVVQPIYEKSSDVVAVLYDDTASMQIRNGQGEARSERLAQSLASHRAEFDRTLASRFHVLDYRFADRARPLEARGQLTYEGRESRIVDAVSQVVRDTDTLSVSAIVVFSDGGQQEDADASRWQALREAGVPVYTVGVGEDTWRDLAVGEVSLSRSFFDDAPARISAQFTASGLAGQTVAVEVLRNGVVQASEERRIERDYAEQQVQLEVAAIYRAWLDYVVRLRVVHRHETEATREYVEANNEASVLLDYRKKDYRILYFSGRPNWQNKFLRRALAGDPELQLSSLVRISGAEKNFVYAGAKTSLGNPLFEGFENEAALPRYDEAVFTRIGLGANELENGYPETPDELYPFHLVIWGDIEADFFAPVHLRLTRDAVAERGASFLMLGGPRTLGDSGYGGSVIESLLPVMPGAVNSALGIDGEPSQVVPSPEGFLTGVVALHRDAEGNVRAWESLPPLPSVDPVGAARIGASVLATAAPPGDAPTPFLLWQRFGQGKSAVLASGETWPWHMQTEAGNDAHERFWRQLVRSLVSTVPDAVALTVEPAAVVVERDTQMTWTVNDVLFVPVEGASLNARVVDPHGESTTVPLVERLDTPGRYSAAFTPGSTGIHRVYLEGVRADGEVQEQVESALLVRPDTREVAEARFDSGLLERIATETGGHYFPLSALGEVAAAVTPSDRAYTRLNREPLWHHPGFYVALLALFCAEWALRRRWGQA